MIKNTIRIVLGAFMLLAGIGHLTYARETFQAQVPDWIPLSKDFVVLASGVVEILLGLAMIFLTKKKKAVGLILAVFFVLVFPGNIAQYIEHRDGFGLDTDSKRLIRLFFQPVLIFFALYSTDALKKFKRS
ncbi:MULTISPECIES: MauE/DoxX family redox-associated membrane protein [unclassified Kaistella]|uniref:DoxX family protein n=1 Tax=unclassified Kaistella TaxID=2762626 RepID=UPI002733AA01|nr:MULTISPECIES: MauE/DoxX family redox-associated membrane protein [unclassified Kaistella]MCZ2084058.1 DoxX family membrane protein [Flavobacteriales bacterium]MDP2452914.1 DoxX family membrane protein [Kaistella sp. SH11-4b]MDP2455823.1 DoxX family membrane protein [Kaistella sp. SH40-3]MDP2458727.1 DoxX family membrane protein [Kaistella sp. SH19-2b]